MGYCKLLLHSLIVPRKKLVTSATPTVQVLHENTWNFLLLDGQLYPLPDVILMSNFQGQSDIHCTTVVHSRSDKAMSECG